MVVNLKANEMVTKAGNVKYHSINGDVKGKLILTNQRIYFKSTENTNGHNMEIMPSEIRELLYFKTGMFSNNGMTVLTKDGQELKFIVKKRNEWSKLINRIY